MVAFDWNKIEGFYYTFREEVESPMAIKQNHFNQNYAGSFAIPDAMVITNDDNTKSLAPDPLMSIRRQIVQDIMTTLNLSDPDQISRFEEHIAGLLMESNFSHTAPNGRITRIRGEQQLIELAQQSLARNDRRIDLEISIEHWVFRRSWTPRRFFKIYTKEHVTKVDAGNPEASCVPIEITPSDTKNVIVTPKEIININKLETVRGLEPTPEIVSPSELNPKIVGPSELKPEIVQPTELKPGIVQSSESIAYSHDLKPIQKDNGSDPIASFVYIVQPSERIVHTEGIVAQKAIINVNKTEIVPSSDPPLTPHENPTHVTKVQNASGHKIHDEDLKLVETDNGIVDDAEATFLPPEITFSDHKDAIFALRDITISCSSRLFIVNSCDAPSSLNVEAAELSVPYIVTPVLPPAQPPPMLLSASPDSPTDHEFVPSTFDKSLSLLLSPDYGSGGVVVAPNGTDNPTQEERKERKQEEEEERKQEERQTEDERKPKEREVSANDYKIRRDIADNNPDVCTSIANNPNLTFVADPGLFILIGFLTNGQKQNVVQNVNEIVVPYTSPPILPPSEPPPKFLYCWSFHSFQKEHGMLPTDILNPRTSALLDCDPRTSIADGNTDLGVYGILTSIATNHNNPDRDLCTSVAIGNKKGIADNNLFLCTSIVKDHMDNCIRTSAADIMVIWTDIPNGNATLDLCTYIVNSSAVIPNPRNSVMEDLRTSIAGDNANHNLDLCTFIANDTDIRTSVAIVIARIFVADRNPFAVPDRRQSISPYIAKLPALRTSVVNESNLSTFVAYLDLFLFIGLLANGQERNVIPIEIFNRGPTKITSRRLRRFKRLRRLLRLGKWD